MSLLEVKIPPMGESISSGILAKWHVKNGDTVKKDQPLFELETDKITSEGVAESAGVITFKAAAGAEVKIGQIVATIDPEASGQKPDASPAPTAATASNSVPLASRLSPSGLCGGPRRRLSRRPPPRRRNRHRPGQRRRHR